MPGATCTDPTYKWTLNSLNQDPCTVASYLTIACAPSGTQPVLNPALNPGWHYGSPAGAGATPCRCSSTYYSMISACSVCQYGQDLTYTQWTANCTETYFQFPEPIPDGTRVPHWAYLPIGPSDTWDPSAASAVVNSPESTPNGPAAQTTSPAGFTSPTTTSLAGLTSPTGSTNPTKTTSPTGLTSTPDGHSSPTGSNTSSPSGLSSLPGVDTLTPGPVITSTTSGGAAGGGGGTRNARVAPRVIAGVVVSLVALALFAILAFIFVRRRNANRRAPSSMIDPNLLRSTTSFGGEKLHYHQSGSTTTTTMTTTSPYPHIPTTSMPPMRLYNPSDPATFPPPVNIHGSTDALSDPTLRPLSRNRQADGTYTVGYARGYHGGAEL